MAEWVNGQLGTEAELVPLPGDAGLTNYYRIKNKTCLIIAMAMTSSDVLKRFSLRHKLLRNADVRVPKVLASDVEHGFAIIEDLGDDLLGAVLEREPERERHLYEKAWRVLALIQKIDWRGAKLPAFDNALLTRELDQFPKWYAANLRNKPLSDEELSDYKKVSVQLKEIFLAQPMLLAHRDYHSRNLFATESEIAVIDFADALGAPQCYDISSLVHDVYRSIDDDTALDYVIRHWEHCRGAGIEIETDFGEYYRVFELVSLQRLVKNLGQFVRLERGDGRAGFMAHVPALETKVHAIAMRYREMRPLGLMVERRIND